MGAVIHFIGRSEYSNYECQPLDALFSWLKPLRSVAVDTETNVVPSILDRELAVISLCDPTEENVWVIETKFLKHEELVSIVEMLANKLCLIQNVPFDYQVFLKSTGVRLRKVYDTMIAEQIIKNGYAGDQSKFGLAAIYLERLGLNISKDEQLTFGGEDPLTDDQIRYAALDVLRLHTLRTMQMANIAAIDKRIKQRGNRGLKKTLWWENEFVKVVAEMETNGVNIDEEWLTIESDLQEDYDKELSFLNDIVVKDFKEILIEMDALSDKPRFVKNVWSSAKAKKLVFDRVYGEDTVQATSKRGLMEFLIANDPKAPEGIKPTAASWNNKFPEYSRDFSDKFVLIKLLILKTKDNVEDIEKSLNDFLMFNLPDLIEEHGYFIPANKLVFNWDSPTQRLKVFKGVDIEIESTSKEVLNEFIHAHPIIPHFLEFAEMSYIKKSFGSNFYHKNRDADGRFRTRFKQILATGRMSSSSPNMLGIPNQERFRGKIKAKNSTLIGADYDGKLTNIYSFAA